MRMAGEINTRKNIYTKKVISAQLCFIIFSAEAQCVHIGETDFIHIIKASVMVTEPKAGFNGMINMLTSFLKG